jgi:hypothetical protein
MTAINLTPYSRILFGKAYRTSSVRTVSYPAFTEFVLSLLCSQESATGTYAEAIKSCSHALCPS